MLWSCHSPAAATPLQPTFLTNRTEKPAKWSQATLNSTGSPGRPICKDINKCHTVQLSSMCHTAQLSSYVEMPVLQVSAGIPHLCLQPVPLQSTHSHRWITTALYSVSDKAEFGPWRTATYESVYLLLWCTWFGIREDSPAFFLAAFMVS